MVEDNTGQVQAAVDFQTLSVDISDGSVVATFSALWLLSSVLLCMDGVYWQSLALYAELLLVSLLILYVGYGSDHYQ